MIEEWKQILITVDCTVAKAIEVIDLASLRSALVVDDQRCLVGIITDGDIRRALLRRVSLDDTVEKVMNPDPVSLHHTASKEIILSVLEEKRLIQIPLVNDNRQVVGIETLEHMSWSGRIDHTVFLMVGGFGKRLRPLTETKPKPLLKIGDYPVLQNILENFIQHGFHRFVFSVHYKSEMIEDYFGHGEKWGVSIEYVYEDQPLGTAGSLAYLSPPSKPIIVMNGDLLTKVNFRAMLDFHTQNNAMATVGVRQYDFQLPYGLIKSKNTYITEFVEKPMYHFFVNAGFYVLSPAVLVEVKKGEVLDMPDLLTRAIQKEQSVMMFPVHEYWLDIGRFDDFEKAKKDIVKHF